MDKKYAWVPAQVKEMSGDMATVRIAEYADEASIMSDGGKGATSWREEQIKVKHYPGKSLPIQNVDKNCRCTCSIKSLPVNKTMGLCLATALSKT